MSNHGELVAQIVEHQTSYLLVQSSNLTRGHDFSWVRAFVVYIKNSIISALKNLFQSSINQRDENID